jgi:hypothetical protein
VIAQPSIRSAKIDVMSGRPRALDAREERELAALLDLGVRQPRIAAVMGCSVRTVQRHAQRRREEAEAQALDLDAALAAIPSLTETLADEHRQRPKTWRARRPAAAWREFADELDAGRVAGELAPSQGEGDAAVADGALLDLG